MGVRDWLQGTVNPETGQREGGILRGGDGQLKTDPISAFGDRVGRGVARRAGAWWQRTFGDDMPGPVGMQNPGGRIGIDRIPGRPVMATRGMPGPVDIPNPRDRSVGLIDTSVSVEPRRQMTPEEIQQQRDQFDRYRNDPNSIYYQGPRAGDPMPGEIVGPNAHAFRNPTRELYDASQIRTGSGDSFRDAVAHYRSLQKPNRNITQ